MEDGRLTDGKGETISFADTFIQDKGINQDFGLFDSPDDFYNMHQQELSPIQRMAFKYVVRHLMNQNVNKIRNIQKASL